MGKSRLSINLPEDLKQELKDFAKEKGLSVTAVLMLAINEILGKDIKKPKLN